MHTQLAKKEKLIKSSQHICEFLYISTMQICVYNACITLYIYNVIHAFILLKNGEWREACILII